MSVISVVGSVLSNYTSKTYRRPLKKMASRRIPASALLQHCLHTADLFINSRNPPTLVHLRLHPRTQEMKYFAEPHFKFQQGAVSKKGTLRDNIIYGVHFAATAAGGRAAGEVISGRLCSWPVRTRGMSRWPLGQRLEHLEGGARGGGGGLVMIHMI